MFITSFTDKILNKGDFNRQVGNRIYHVHKGKVNFIYETLNLQREKITKARVASKFTLNMLTLDIET